MLDVRRMRVLREVAARGSFSAAADSLAYTQSAISQQIAALEREAGTTLVERNARGVRLTDAGRDDPLFGALPGEFTAYLGHKEAVARLPDGAVLLASTDTCPVHAFRIGRNVYATQFHPELDAVAICDRIDAYSAHGYYEPHEQEHLKAAAREAMVTEPVRLLARFVELYARP